MYQRVLVLAGMLLLAGCSSRSISVTSDGGQGDRGQPRDGVVLQDRGGDLAPSDDAARPCAAGQVSVTTDRTTYTLKEAESARALVCNGLAESIWLWVCNPVVTEHLEAGLWTATGGKLCAWDGMEHEVPPGTQVLEVRLNMPGFWRIKAEYLPACDEGDCGAPVTVTSPVAWVKSELTTDSCSAEHVCGGGPQMMCLSPGSCIPGGQPPPETCWSDGECKNLGAHFICSHTCSGSFCAPGCLGPEDCPEGTSCGADHHCQGKSCAGPTGCPLNFTCSRSGQCERMPCSQSNDCTGYCVEGLCYEVPGSCFACCPP